MSKVDWSLAPSDAQIYSPEFGDCNAVWYKVDGGKVFCWPIGSHGWSERHKMIGELIYRPKQDPKPWSGPEDGLPPVGQELEFKVSSGKWWKATVFAVKYNTDESADVLVDHQEGWAFVDSNSHRLRPIKTPEQLAADKRETAIREIMDVADVDCRVTAARLVDAGFKREVV